GVIGSGPAGLSCATYLARLGYAVTIYDRRSMAGGLNTYGMAEYKMTQQHSLDEVAQVEKLGVAFQLNTEIGKDISFADLEAKHDAIFIGAGLGGTQRLNIPGEELLGVYDSLDFIQRIKTRDWSCVPMGNRIAVIGAGNTAIDVVTQAKRLGAEHVMLIYRRTEREMPAYEYEYELAKQDGVEFLWQTAPVEIIASNDGSHVAAIKCVKTELKTDATSGQQRIVTVNGSEFVLPVDMVVKALGQEKLKSFLSTLPNVNLDASGRVIVSQATMQTDNPKYFAGGDCVNGGSEAVNAAQHGKLAAQGIHKFLFGEEIYFEGGK
ncbi:MAG TPA: FAD-dependent oxidoreductase, partial [Blastocatellia bacterium]|nr:FAD-dependent oxidoreductase [Blastocatellia bacterium]